VQLWYNGGTDSDHRRGIPMSALRQPAVTRPRMTAAEIEARARDRAVEERLHSFAIEAQRLYLVKSRQSAPGTHHMCRVIGDHIGARVTCDCKGYQYRSSCTHSAVVIRRGEREGWLPRTERG